MSLPTYINNDLQSLRQIQSVRFVLLLLLYTFYQILNRRTAAFRPAPTSILTKALIGSGAVLLLGGLMVALVVPFVVTASNIPNETTLTTGDHQHRSFNTFTFSSFSFQNNNFIFF